MKKQQTLAGLIHFLVLAALAASGSTASAQSTEKSYYWVAPQSSARAAVSESFVIEADARQAAEIDAIRNVGGIPIFGGQVAAGSVRYNKNYNAPGHPVWNWHIESIGAFFDLRTSIFPACLCPYLVDNPSDIAADPARWIRENNGLYTPINYEIQKRIDPTRSDALANVSNRGITGAAEKTLITGLIITGGEPRNVVVRALGPSLSAIGVRQAAANPKIEVYMGSERIAVNADWATDERANSLRASYPSLAPTNRKEAALLLTLPPGAYTLHGINEDGSEAVILIEAYDVDANVR